MASELLARRSDRHRHPRGRVMGALDRGYRTAMMAITVAGYTVLAPFGYVGFGLLALLPTRDAFRRALRLQAIMRRAFTFMHDWLRVLGVIDYNPRRITGGLGSQPCVVIANHPSLDDVTTIMGAFPRVCTAVNRRTFHRWFLRPLLEQAGQFSGGSHTLLGTKLLIDGALGRLTRGFHVLVFPEGHRSPQGRLRPFTRGAFEIACRARVPIVPILIRTEPRWLTRKDRLPLAPPLTPSRHLEVLDALHPEAFDYDSRAMREHAEKLYSRLLGVPVARPEPAALTSAT